MSDFYSDDGSGDPFWENLGQEEAPVEASAEETIPETGDAPVAEQGRERDPETGRFLPKSEAASEEPAELPPSTETGEPEAAPDTSDAEALKAQIAALEKRLADKDDFAGRLSNELGELRKLQEQIAENQARPQVSDWESLIDDNPAKAAQIALQAGNNIAYQQARQAWDELAPGAPDLFEQNLRFQKQLADMEAKLHETTAPIAAQQTTQQVAQAYSQIKERYPDWDEFEDAMAQAVETRPLLKESLSKVLSSGDTVQQVAALEDLYLITAGRKSDTLAAETKKVAQSLAEETLQAKQDAVVVSATSAVVEQPRTRHDDLWDVAAADEEARASGWNLGPR